jgi:hypothetical protein
VKSREREVRDERLRVSVRGRRRLREGVRDGGLRGVRDGGRWREGHGDERGAAAERERGRRMRGPVKERVFVTLKKNRLSLRRSFIKIFEKPVPS